MSNIVEFVKNRFLPECVWDYRVTKTKSYEFLKFLNGKPANMKILNNNDIITEIVEKLFSPDKMGYMSNQLNYIDIKNDEGKYISIECPFIGNIAEHFKDSQIQIPLEFYSAVLNTGIYTLIIPGTTPQQIYEFLIYHLGFINKSSQNLILLTWKQFRHLLKPKIEWIFEIFLEQDDEIDDESIMNNPVVTEIITDYKNGIDKRLSPYIIKDLRNIIFGYIYNLFYIIT